MNHPFPATGHIHVNLTRTTPDPETGVFDTAMQVDVKAITAEDAVRVLGVIAKAVQTDEPAMRSFLDFVKQGAEMCLSVIGEEPTADGIPDELRSATGLNQH